MRSAEPAASLEASASPPLIAGRYRVEGALGRGGAGQVLRVVDVVRGQALALKRLDPAASKGVQALFEREYQTLASLRHPRIVQVYEYGRDQGAAFYTMELLQGEDLKGRSPMPWREACRYLRDAAQALGLLHARRLVHRDVSPRNLWRTPDGRVKLLDFGALAPFGTCEQLVGTPPLVPPEAYYAREVDQRTDLYALGGVAYYLLTGLHAYPARELRELPEFWQYDVAPPSQRVVELGRDGLEPVPAELDALIAALLSTQPVARPSSAAELIDRLDALLGSPRASEAEVAQTHLANPAFVGRARERRRLRRQLLLASHGRGQSCVIEAAAGLGRSRLLRELAVEAQLVPATVLHLDAASAQGNYGLAAALALKLLEALPELARRHAEPYQGLLAHISPRVRAELRAEPALAAEANMELRLRIQAALRDWFISVASERLLVVLVDGLELVDEGSLAFLLGLAFERRHARLLLVCALLRERTRKPTQSERALLKKSRRLTLEPLPEADSRALLGSVFGEAENLSRLVSHLERVARGNPGHLLELSEQLVRRNVIGLIAGSWVLPRELPDALLSRTREESLAARLEFIAPPARQLGRVLSVYEGVIPLGLCQAMAASVSADLFQQLERLCEHEIMIRVDDGVRFAHERLRVILFAELELAQRQSVQRAIGAYLLARPELDSLGRLTAGVQQLASGDADGAGVAVRAALEMTLTESGKLKYGLPAIERTLNLLRQQKRPRYELIALLGPLSIGGYLSDWRYAARYGDMALAALSDTLGLDLAKRLRPFLGRKLALVLALGTAALRFGIRRGNPRVPSFREALLLLLGCATSLTATRTICLDPTQASRAAEALEPLTALGPKHAASLLYEFCGALAATVRDGYAQTYARWQQLIARLSSPEPIRGLPEPLKVQFLAGAISARAAMECMRDDERALRAADQLEQFGLELYKLSADQLRTVYYANQGNRKLFELCRERTEQHVIQQGTSWQAETWAASTMTTVYLRTQDAMGMKRVSEQLHRLSAEIPSLDPYSRRSRGSYLLLRRRYTEALPWLEEVLDEEPPGAVGWTRTHGSLARAYNRLGEHERARATCQRALRYLQPEDLAFVGTNLIVQLEALIAEAGLGHVEDAQRKLAALIAVHAPNQGGLTMGQLHDAGVEIALLARDLDAAQRHFAELERWYLATGMASLAERCQLLAKRVHTGQRLAPSVLPSPGEPSSEAFTVGPGTSARTIERMLGGSGISLRDRAHKALQILAENTSCAHGFLYLLDSRRQPRLEAALREQQPDPELEGWALARLAREFVDERTELQEHDDDNLRPLPPTLLRQGGCAYSVVILYAAGAEANGVVAAAVLGTEDGDPTPCSADVLGAVGYHLQRALRTLPSDPSPLVS